MILKRVVTSLEFGKGGPFGWRSQAPAILAAVVIALAATHASFAQERLPLKITPESQGVRIEGTQATRSLRLSPLGEMRPLYYSSTFSLTNAHRKWATIPGIADPDYVNGRSLTLTNLPDAPTAKFIQAVYPDFSKLNGFVRLPAGIPRDRLTTLAVMLHPSLGVTNAGLAFEQQLGPVCDKYSLVSYFPSALAVDPSDGSFWRGQDGPQAPDYASVLDGITACKILIPSIERVKIAAYSRGVETAIGLVQLWPEKFDGLLIISGYDNPATAAYAKRINAGEPVRFSQPFPVVGLASPRDEYSTFGGIRAACAWFAEANGLTATYVTNSVKRDYIQSVPGVDGAVVKMGQSVRFIIHDAKNHYDSLFLSDAGFEELFGKFIREGNLPATE
jgi:hypothetical protein